MKKIASSANYARAKNSHIEKTARFNEGDLEILHAIHRELFIPSESNLYTTIFAHRRELTAEIETLRETVQKLREEVDGLGGKINTLTV
jgi:hypothetical protein